jgi:hypothetical protein
MAVQASLVPSGYNTLEDASGASVPGGLVWTYQAGTSAPLATYTDATLTVPNANPIVCDGAGRWTAWVTTGTVLKLVFEGPATPPAHGPILKTVDGLQTAAPPTLQLLKSDSGTYSLLPAAQVSGVVIPAGLLTLTDTLLVYYTMQVTGGSPAANGVYLATAGAPLCNLSPVPYQPNIIVLGQAVIKIEVPNSINWMSIAQGMTHTNLRADNCTLASGTAGNWTGGFTLGLQSGGLPAGGGLVWQWQVYKLASQ